MTHGISPARVEPSVQITLRAWGALREDLNRMPEFKSGTAWETDRRRELARLVEQLGRLGLSVN